MSFTGLREFDATLQKTNGLLKDIEAAYGWENRRNQSYAALRSVLHALRDRLTVQETAQLGAQLPMLVRGIYYAGWRPERVPIKMSRDEFLQAVRREFPYSLPRGIDIDDVVRVVLAALRKFVSVGEWDDIASVVPKDIREVVSSVRV
jgi:uncharacterized protein (DUF2267 family)